MNVFDYCGAVYRSFTRLEVGKTPEHKVDLRVRRGCCDFVVHAAPERRRLVFYLLRPSSRQARNVLLRVRIKWVCSFLVTEDVPQGSKARRRRAACYFTR